MAMIINELKLTNFRNYKKLSIDFGKTTVIIGPNGIGKTNILEALFILACAKSFRIKDERNLIKHGNSFAKISAEANNSKIDFFILFKEPKIIKKVKINDVEKKFINLVGRIKTVLFSPESLQIITGPPRERRKFLDLTLVQNNKTYTQKLLELKKIIIQRNGLLKLVANQKAQEQELDFWDQKLIEVSVPIIKERKEYLRYINQNINKYYQEIDQKNKYQLKIIYHSFVEDIERYEKILAVGRAKEIFNQKTIFSPHLDDFIINITGRIFREIASRGEIRSFIIALKMIEAEFLSKDKEPPIILLDDVLSELDSQRRAAVLKMISGRQSIITTTEINDLKNLGKEIKIIDLNNK